MPKSHLLKGPEVDDFNWFHSGQRVRNEWRIGRYMSKFHNYSTTFTNEKGLIWSGVYYGCTFHQLSPQSTQRIVYAVSDDLTKWGRRMRLFTFRGQSQISSAAKSNVVKDTFYIETNSKIDLTVFYLLFNTIRMLFTQNLLSVKIVLLNTVPIADNLR